MEYGQLQVHLEYLVTIAGYDNIHPGCRRLNGIGRYLPVVKSSSNRDGKEQVEEITDALMHPCIGCKRKLSIETDRTNAWKKMKLDTIIQGARIPRMNTRIADYIITYATPPLHHNNYVCKCTRSLPDIYSYRKSRKWWCAAAKQHTLCLNIAALTLQVPDYSILQINIGTIENITIDDFMWDSNYDMWKTSRHNFKQWPKLQGCLSLFMQHEIYKHLAPLAMFDFDNNSVQCATPNIQYYIPSKHVTLSITKSTWWGYFNCLNHRFKSKNLMCTCPKSPSGRYVLDVIKKHAVHVQGVAAIIHEYWSVF